MFDKGYIEYIDQKSREYLQKGRFREGLALYNILFSPENYSYILSGNMQMGSHNDVRKFMANPQKYYKKQWNNEDLANKKLLIYHYFYGIGDYIMCARYIHLLQKMSCKIVLELSDGLIDIYRYNFPDCEIIKWENKEYTDGYDYTCHHQYLLNFQNSLNSIPYSEGYLRADSKLVEKYRPIFNTDKIKVGVFHASNNPDRSVPFQLMRGIYENRQCQFYCLATGSPSQELAELQKEYNVIELNQYIKNVNDTAALMENMDLVISVDSFPIHLAGALGVKSYLMLNYDSDWRWFNDTETTPWYDSVKIFKQKKSDYWYNVIDDISDALKKDF